jgi:predicted Zn-dependent protease
VKNYFDQLCQFCFSALKPQEYVTASLTGEDSSFLRLSQALVRQNTLVEQYSLSLQFIIQKRKITYELALTQNKEADQNRILSLLERARQEAQILPEDPFVVIPENNGTSDVHHAGSLLSPTDALDAISTAAAGSDFVGLYAAGTVFRGSQNSVGQKHWFSSESFFMDYSLYTKNVDGENKAVKSVYADSKWNSEKMNSSVALAKNQISLLKRKSTTLKPGKYRAYLALGAVAEIAPMLGWGALSFAAVKTGRSAFKKMFEKEKSMSPLLTVKENFSLGLTPQFNSLGEVSPMELPLIERGELKNLIISTRSAKEYGVTANGGDMGQWSFEGPRSLEISGGLLAEKNALKELGTGLYLGNLHYLNWSEVQNARITGMTRYACFWVENGEIVGPIKDMRFDESLFDLWGANLEAITQEQHIDPVTMTYGYREIGGKKLPGMLVSEMNFTL